MYKIKINKISNGFEMNLISYEFINNEYEIISEEQVHINTDKGTILFDLSVLINDKQFTDINEFIYYLYGESN